MLDNFKLAVKKQKKLIFIFLLTIFIPSIALSIFGVRAIRSERFRITRQIETEHRRAAESIKLRIASQFEELETLLRSMAREGAIQQRDAAGIKNAVEALLAENPLVEQVFIAFDEDEPFFPFFEAGFKGNTASSGQDPTPSHQARLRRAESAEFTDRDYRVAAAQYQRLFESSDNRSFKARMLTGLARCLSKAGDDGAAINVYQRVCEDYPESRGPSGLPLALVSRLQMAQCYTDQGELEDSLHTSLVLYGKILDGTWPLTEAQFKTYAGLVADVIDALAAEDQPDLMTDAVSKDLDQLKHLHRLRLDQWSVINDIKGVIVPELRSRQSLPEGQSELLQHHQNIGGRDYLISAVSISSSPETRPAGLLGVKVREQHLLENVVPDALDSLALGDTAEVVISHLSGEVLLGAKDPSQALPATREYFDNNFPPWSIAISRTGRDTSSALDLKRNFYFWTIVTLVVVLIAGAVLISRTIAQEMAVLRLKADFVSSVSHEFKSPLTSIKALAERLRDGKVADPVRMREYFSIITQDADRLTDLVRNVLDFSKIEEGKKEYEFSETDIAELTERQVAIFQQRESAQGVEVRVNIPEDLPLLHVDAGALSQALNNLLDNAAKFSSAPRKIDVNLKKDDARIVLEVRDNGIGIPPEELDKIFDKFYQAPQAVSQSAKGTGLGLTLVRHIVEAHGGRVTVVSRMGEGSTFSILLPIPKEKR